MPVTTTTHLCIGVFWLGGGGIYTTTGPQHRQVAHRTGIALHTLHGATAAARQARMARAKMVGDDLSSTVCIYICNR